MDCGFGGIPEVLSGAREGSTTVYHPGKYPYQVMGKVTFNWRPLEDGSSRERIVWLWVHSSFCEELKVPLFEALSLAAVCQEEAPPPTKKAKREKKDVLGEKLKTKNVPYHKKVPKYVSQCGTVKAAFLKDTLNR